MATGAFAVAAANPARPSADSQRLELREPLARHRDHLLDPLRELLDTGLDRQALCLGFAGDRLEAAAELGLCLREPLFQGGDDLVALPLEARRCTVDPLLEPLDAGVRDLGRLLGQHARALARERLHRAVELAGQAA